MLANTFGETLASQTFVRAYITDFLGEPLVAMLVSVALSSTTLVYSCAAATPKSCASSLGASLKPIAGILLIIAGGGAFKQVLVKAHVGDAIVQLTNLFALPPIVLGWVIAMLLSVATGSATVGIVGAAGAVGATRAEHPDLNLPLLALSIGSGSLFFNYR